jgi:phosphoribosylamine--glycine ligase
MLDGDLLEIMEAVTDGRLAKADIKWKQGASCCVVMAADGYPGQYEKGKVIRGIDALQAGVTVYHAGTMRENGGYVTRGGRVLGVTARGDTLAAAVESAYSGVGLISWDGARYRTDIGRQAISSRS